MNKSDAIAQARMEVHIQPWGTQYRVYNCGALGPSVDYWKARNARASQCAQRALQLMGYDGDVIERYCIDGPVERRVNMAIKHILR